MTVKYHCSQCGKRYVDWGAKNLDFKCPDCEDGELVPMSQSESEAPKKKPSLKRKRKSKSKSKKKDRPASTPEQLGNAPNEIEGAATLDAVPDEDPGVSNASLEGADGQVEVGLVNDVTDVDASLINDSLDADGAPSKDEPTVKG